MPTYDNLPSHIRYLAGIDEAGRGPLAGPVAVGLVLVNLDHLNRVVDKLYGVRDSKKLSSQKREVWASVERDLRDRGLVKSAVSLVGSKHIDSKGISSAIKTGISRTLHRLDVPTEETFIFLDGGLRAPRKFSYQQTIIGGDDKISLISLASILAKVRRDRYMQNLGDKMPEYGFHQHKGYGTKEHLKSIRMHGLSEVHRRDFVHI